MRHITLMFGILTFLIACNPTIPVVSPRPIATTISTGPTSTVTPLPMVSPGPTSTLTKEQMIMAGAGARFGAGFYFNRADCIQAIESGTTKQCVFPTGTELITKSEWKQLLPDTVFYLVDMGSWRSAEQLLAHETQDGGISRHLVAWQDGQTYFIEKFNHLLEVNGITIIDPNRELIAKAFALMSIPNYLGGEVRFLKWEPVEPGNYRHNYSHALKAWTEVWGCEMSWWFVFTDQKLSLVTRGGVSSCYVSEYGDYIEERRYFELGDEGVVLGVGPSLEDYYFNR